MCELTHTARYKKVYKVQFEQQFHDTLVVSSHWLEKRHSVHNSVEKNTKWPPNQLTSVLFFQFRLKSSEHSETELALLKRVFYSVHRPPGQCTVYKFQLNHKMARLYDESFSMTVTELQILKDVLI